MGEFGVLLACSALGLVFAWSAVAKLARFQEWSSTLARYRLGDGVTKIARVGVPLVEIATAALLLTSVSRAGAASTLLLVAGFSLAILRARRVEGDRLPCGCFGKAKARDYRVMLMRNALLAVLAAVILLSGREVAVLGSLGAPGGADALPVLLVGVGAVSAAWMVWAITSMSRGGRS
jgi:hypothetical protein